MAFGSWLRGFGLGVHRKNGPFGLICKSSRRCRSFSFFLFFLTLTLFVILSFRCHFTRCYRHRTRFEQLFVLA
jgi:hypothetical protein